MKNWKTTLSGLTVLFLLGLSFYQVVPQETLNGLIVGAVSLGLISAADAGKMRGRGFMAMLLGLPLVLGSCNRATLDSVIANLEREVPLQKVDYRIQRPQTDTVIVFDSPYRLFVNKAVFNDTIVGLEQKFNWQGLGDLIWKKLQEHKAKRKAPALTPPQRRVEGRKDSLKTGYQMKELYKSLEGRLTERIPELAQIGRYNKQYEQEADNFAVVTPAVFVEFLNFARGSDAFTRGRRGVMTLRMHAVSSMYADSQRDSTTQEAGLADLDLEQAVYKAIEQYKPPKGSALEWTNTEIDHSHDSIVVHKLDFELEYFSC
jgi:hypothetical protein